LTIELRPSSQAEGGFILPPSQIRPTFEENLLAAFKFIGQTLEAEIETNSLQP
jgi:carboxypeptidase T